jgi:hypothetical protein
MSKTIKPHRAARFVALDWMLEQARKHEHESNGPNRSPLIDRINKAAGVPLGSSYCAAALRYAFGIAGVTFGGPHAASVGYEEQWAREHGYLVTRPLHGDVFNWRIDGDGWPDHTGMVVRVRSILGLYFIIDTVEANTSSGNAGSQADGGGWFCRQREFVRGRVKFVRDPRPATKDPFAPRPAAKPKTKAAAKKKPAAPRRRYYTHRHDVPLKAGQQLAFQPGKGYYARPKPKKTTTSRGTAAGGRSTRA